MKDSFRKYEIIVKAGESGNYIAAVFKRKRKYAFRMIGMADGFVSEQLALMWAQDVIARRQALKSGKAVLHENDHLMAENEVPDEALFDQIEGLSFQSLLAQIDEGTAKSHIYLEIFKAKVSWLLSALVTEYQVRQGRPEEEAEMMARNVVGENIEDQLKAGRNGTLDGLNDVVKEIVIEHADRQRQYEIECQHIATDTALEILRVIRTIDGEKAVIISTSRTQSFDIDSQGRVGYEPEHESVMLKLIDDGLLFDKTGTIHIEGSHTHKIFLSKGSWDYQRLD